MRIPLDIVLVFSANPEDYTNRGNIITPLKDRIDSQILTHYPQTSTTRGASREQEAWLDRERDVDDRDSRGRPRCSSRTIAFVARASELVDQSSGVSARCAISAMELLPRTSSAAPRSRGDRTVFPRLSDLPMLLPAITGKVEMVYEGEQQGAEVVARKLIGQAVAKLFETKFPPIERAGVRAARGARAPRLRRDRHDDFDDAFAGRRGEAARSRSAKNRRRAAAEPAYDAIVAWFVVGQQDHGLRRAAVRGVLSRAERVPKPARDAREVLQPQRDEELAFWMEMVLEGLHQALRLAREDLDSTITFQELMKFNVLRTVR